MLAGTKGPGDSRNGSTSTVFASLAALGSAILASSCCLPLLPFLLAAGAAGTSAFFVRIRPFPGCRLHSFCGVRFLSGVAGQEVPSPAERGEHDSPLGLGGCCGRLYPVPTGHRKSRG